METSRSSHITHESIVIYNHTRTHTDTHTRLYNLQAQVHWAKEEERKKENKTKNKMTWQGAPPPYGFCRSQFTLICRSAEWTISIYRQYRSHSLFLSLSTPPSMSVCVCVCLFKYRLFFFFQFAFRPNERMKTHFC